MSRRLLIIDDEQSMLDLLSLLFEGEGFEAVTASSVTEARDLLAQTTPDLVLCDILMPDGSGLDVLHEIKSGSNPPPVLMMTAYPSTRSAIEAMKLGAYDYIAKPFHTDEVKLLVAKALEKADLEEENLYLKKELQERYTFSNIIGRSPKMQAIFSLIERVARTTSTVLVHGESGTGKELIARAIHFASARAEQRFLSINCGALPEALLESELFGHERGAFTGAVKEKKGLFQEASGGTLFLDEIGEMTPTMQVKLLRALQERKIRKVGGNREEEVDVRVIAASNQDLEEKIAQGEFREDLYYRVNVIPIHLPPLRERREDIPLLVDFFTDKFSRRMDIPSKGVSAEVLAALEQYDWPGNVRELENLIERCLALAPGPTITLRDLPPAVLGGRQDLMPSISLPEEGLDLEGYLDEVRARLMGEALDRSRGVQTQAADLLGMSFRSFRYYAKKLGLRGEEEGSIEGS